MVSALTLALLAAVTGGADDAKPSPAEQLAAWKKEVTAAQTAAFDLYNKAEAEKDEAKAKKLSAEADELYKTFSDKQADLALKAASLAKQDPKSAVALDTAVWALRGLRDKPAEVKALVALVAENHIESPKIRPVAAGMRFYRVPPDEAAKFLTAVAEKNGDKATKATALLGLADIAMQRAAPYGEAPPANAAELRKEAEATLERVVREFGDVAWSNKTTFGDRVKGELFELRNLQIGMTIPDIEGEDTDGAKFKLSDYRGKVVVLDFWGHW